MTVVDGRIRYIGSKETALTLCDANTIVMDYSDNFIYPGFMEAHCHTVGAGQVLIGVIPLRDGKSLQDYVDIMKKYIANEEIYKVQGFMVRDEQPTAAMLDAICADKQVIAVSEDGHSIWVNTKVMEEYGVTPERA